MIINIDTRTRVIRICTEHRIYNDAEFESKHPRDKDGKFTSGGRTSSPTTDPDYRPRVPRGKLAYKVDFKRLKPDLVNTVTNALQQDMTLYPFMKDHFSFVGTDCSEFATAMGNRIRPEDKTSAFYQPEPFGGRGQICFSPEALEAAQKREKLLKVIQKHEGEYVFFGASTPKEIADHEFGHALWYQMGLNKDTTDSALKKYVIEYMKHHSAEDIARNLSDYANTSPGEFFAEAFAELRNNPTPRPLATKIGELLNKEVKHID